MKWEYELDKIKRLEQKQEKCHVNFNIDLRVNDEKSSYRN